MLKKILALSLAVLMLACLFTGCKQDEVKEPTDTPDVEVTQPDDTEIENPENTEPETPEVTVPEDTIPEETTPSDALEDFGDLFVFTSKFKNDFAFKDEHLTVVFENCVVDDDLGVLVYLDVQDALNRKFEFNFTKGAYINNCLIWPSIFYDEEVGKYVMGLTSADMGVYGIRDIRSFKAEDIEVYDMSTGEACKVISLTAHTDSTLQEKPKEGEAFMSIKDVEIIKHYTEYGYAEKEPLFVIKNNANDVYSLRLTRLVVGGEEQEIDPAFGEQAAIKGTSAIYPIKAFVQFGMNIPLYDETSIVCDFELYNVTTGVVAQSLKNVEIQL